jgi:hypothetical protein
MYQSVKAGSCLNFSSCLSLFLTQWHSNTPTKSPHTFCSYLTPSPSIKTSAHDSSHYLSSLLACLSPFCWHCPPQDPVCVLLYLPLLGPVSIINHSHIHTLLCGVSPCALDSASKQNKAIKPKQNIVKYSHVYITLWLGYILRNALFICFPIVEHHRVY